MRMERNRDTSGRTRWWKCASEVVRIDQFCPDGLGAIAKLNEQALPFTEAGADEKNLLAARDWSIVWADLSKGNPWRRRSLNGGDWGLGDCPM